MMAHELALWLGSFIEANENGEISERDLIILEEIRGRLDAECAPDHGSTDPESALGGEA